MKKITTNLIKLKGKLTLRAFSEKVGIGQSTMHNYLHGRNVPSNVIEKVCKATGCSADWLLGLKQGKVGDAEVKLAGAVMSLKADVIEKNNLIKQLEG